MDKWAYAASTLSLLVIPVWEIQVKKILIFSKGLAGSFVGWFFF